MVKLTKEQIQKLRQVRITTLLGVHDTGRRFAIKCPFHANGNERTPSCYIFPDGGFKCFSCGVHGQNSIDFLMAFGNSFSEVLEELQKYVVVS